MNNPDVTEKLSAPSTSAPRSGWAVWELLILFFFFQSLIGVAWFAFDHVDNERFGAVIVGSVNFISGSACTLILQEITKRRRQSNAPHEPRGAKS